MLYGWFRMTISLGRRTFRIENLTSVDVPGAVGAPGRSIVIVFLVW